MGVCAFSLAIVDWLALSPGVLSKTDWHQWVLNGCTWPDSPSPLKAESVPSVFRRRISSLSKMGLQVALSLSENRQVDYAVFSSRHGELSRTTKLIQEILSGDDASPTAFSQSVHSTSAGLFTIIGNRPVPFTSIAAGYDGFHEAMIDAYTYLVQHSTHTVMLVDFDETLPEPYQVYDTMPYPGHALGLLLQHGTQMSCRGFREEHSVHPALPQALEFLCSFLSNDNQWACTSPRYRWQWSRQPA